MPLPAFSVKRLRDPAIPTPHRVAGRHDDNPTIAYVPEAHRVLVDPTPGADQQRTFEKAGPRELIAFDPAKTTAAILTSGGLCPGLNAVISAVFMSLRHHYGVERILGVPNGYAGMMPPRSQEIRPLEREDMRRIARTGGSFLGSARIQPDVARIVDTLQAYRVDLLFTIGGDGTQKGAHAIHQEIERRGLAIGVVGVPKTIDNDIGWVDRTFGYDTAVEIARQAIAAANTEAECAINGLGLVKLMGRDSGFIAAGAAIAAADANYCLIPEVPFALAGEHGLLRSLQRRLERRGHAVVVVAEGAGQQFFNGQSAGTDASGNKLHNDIGLLLKDRIGGFFAEAKVPIAMKYIDPSYIIRAAPANASDQILCTSLGHAAVHAAMAGKTDMIVGSCNGQLTNVPIPLAVETRKKVDPRGELWRTVLETTGQGPLVDAP